MVGTSYAEANDSEALRRQLPHRVLTALHMRHPETTAQVDYTESSYHSAVLQPR